MEVPAGIDLSWAVLVFLGTGACGVFLLSWKLFNVRTADHAKIADDLLKVKTDLEKVITKNHAEHTKVIEDKYNALELRISRNREDMTSKIEGKCESIKSDIDRNEKATTEQYKELHGRMNKGTDELSEVYGEMREVRGELKIVTKLVMKDIE